MENGLPYLRGEKSAKKKMIARFICGSEKRENEYWKKEDLRKCKICGEGRETIEHMESGYTKSFRKRRMQKGVAKRRGEEKWMGY